MAHFDSMYGGLAFGVAGSLLLQLGVMRCQLRLYNSLNTRSWELF